MCFIVGSGLLLGSFSHSSTELMFLTKSLLQISKLTSVVIFLSRRCGSNISRNFSRISLFLAYGFWFALMRFCSHPLLPRTGKQIPVSELSWNSETHELRCRVSVKLEKQTRTCFTFAPSLENLRFRARFSQTKLKGFYFSLARSCWRCGETSVELHRTDTIHGILCAVGGC